MGKGRTNKKRKLDDLTAVRTVVETLQSFDNDVRDRILRWASEKLEQLADATRQKANRKATKKAKRKAKPGKKAKAGKKKAAKKKTKRG